MNKIPLVIKVLINRQKELKNLTGIGGNVVFAPEKIVSAGNGAKSKK